MSIVLLSFIISWANRQALIKINKKPFCFFEDVISTNKDGLSFLPHYNWESLMRVYCSNKKMISKRNNCLLAFCVQTRNHRLYFFVWFFSRQTTFIIFFYRGTLILLMAKWFVGTWLLVIFWSRCERNVSANWYFRCRWRSLRVLALCVMFDEMRMSIYSYCLSHY